MILVTKPTAVVQLRLLDYSTNSDTMIGNPHLHFTQHDSWVITPMSTFKLYLFGSPRLERDGVAVKISRRKARALLCYLAATGKPHVRDSLATLFWPAYGQSEARVALSRHLYDLNQILVDDALVLETESVALRDDFWLDVAEFAAVLAAHPTVTARELPTVQAAIDLYRADFLAGFTLPDCPDFDEWQAFQSETLRQTLRAALEKVALAQAAMHDGENAIATARRQLALDPLDEAAHRTLMQLYAQAGQQAAALRQYDQCRQKPPPSSAARPNWRR